MSDTLATETLETFLAGVAAVTDDPQAEDALQQWATEAKEELGNLMDQEQAPDGPRHAPLAASTVAKKGHDRILWEFGDLRESVAGTGSGHIEDVSPNSVVLGTEHEKKGAPVASYLQRGTSRMPARPFIGATENMGDRAAELVGDAILRQIDQL